MPHAICSGSASDSGAASQPLSNSSSKVMAGADLLMYRIVGIKLGDHVIDSGLCKEIVFLRLRGFPFFKVSDAGRGTLATDRSRDAEPIKGTCSRS